MEKKIFEKHLIVLSVCVTFIICSLSLGAFLVKARRSAPSGGITVTGSASMDFESDLIVWSGSCQESGDSLTAAYKKIQDSEKKIREFLIDRGVSEEDVVFGSVQIQRKTVPIYDDNGNYIKDEEAGYELSQTFVVSSMDLDLVSAISRDISVLIAAGVAVESNAPEYYCSNLDEIKLELIEAAAANARQRAEIVAEQAGAKLGALKSANLGVFQVTAVNSGTAEYGSTGTLNTSSRYKTAMITTKLNYEAR